MAIGMQLGISFDGLSEPKDFINLARQAEESNITSLWLSEHIGYRDTFVTAAQLMAATQHARIIPTAVSPYLKHPMVMAMALGSLHEMGPGRTGLTLGTGQPRDMASIGMKVERPLGKMREAVLVLRQLLGASEGRVDFQGERFSLTSAYLQEPLRHSPPIYLAAVGEKMLRLAGEVADGVTLSLGCSPEYIKWARQQIAEGARQAGRDPSEIAVNAYILVAIAEDEEEALKAARQKLAFILRGAHHAQNLALSGVQLDQDALREALDRGDETAIAALLPREVVRAHAVAGTPETALPIWRKYAQEGVNTAVLSLSGPMSDRLQAIQYIASIED